MASVPAPPPQANPRPIDKLGARWKKQATEPESTTHLPLSALLLYGLTYDADLRPSLDVLYGVLGTVEGWLEAAGDAPEAAQEQIVRVSKLEVMMLSRRLDVALELLRREET